MANETTDQGESTVHGTVTAGDAGTSSDLPKGEQPDNGLAVENQKDVGTLQGEVKKLQEVLSKAQSERDKTSAKLEQLEKLQKEFSDKSLNESQKVNYAQQRKALVEKINAGWDGDVAVDLFERVLADAESGAVNKMSPEISELKAELAEMKKLLKESHPERAKYADKIAELRAELPDMDDDTLLKIAKRDATKAVRSGSVAPGTTATLKGPNIQGDVALSDSQTAWIKSMYPKATDAELKQVAKNLAAKKGVK